MMADDQALQGQPSHLANGSRGRSQLLPYQPHGFTAFRLPGKGGDHFHCTVEASPGIFGVENLPQDSFAERKKNSPTRFGRGAGSLREYSGAGGGGDFPTRILRCPHRDPFTDRTFSPVQNWSLEIPSTSSLPQDPIPCTG